MKLTVQALFVVVALIATDVFVEACPYLTLETEELPGLETVETAKVRGSRPDEGCHCHRRRRITDTSSRASFRARIRKFLNRFDFLGIVRNPAATPKPPPLTKAPVLVPPSNPAAAPMANAPSPMVTPPVAAPVTTITNLTTAQAVAAARIEIGNIIRSNGNTPSKFIRLSFHDCVGGACDGCVDMANLDNTGLNVPIASLAPVVSKYAAAGNTTNGLTRADIWALAGLVAAQRSQGIFPTLDFNLTHIGRPVCANLPNGEPATYAGPDRKLPSAHVTTLELLEYFATNFGFSDNETVAIMGAHTVGTAASQNSGFSGGRGWDADAVTLNHDFYQTLLLNGRVHADLVPDLQNNAAAASPSTRRFPNQFQWRFTSRNGFMLNADLALVVDMAGYLDPTNGAVNCSAKLNDTSLPTCPDAARTLPASINYASNNVAWVTDFHNAFVKMVHTGCNSNTVCTAL